ncbi:MAG: metallophosphoesterase [Rhodospirillales bacterium]|nr:metallophosphoesterase [Rhodospirillales bacterium]
MIIAQISDSHIDPDSPNAAARVRDLERCVDDINGLDPLPDVVVHTGDLTHNGTPAKYKEALDILRRLRCPLHVVAGNRDDRALIAANFPTGRDLLPGTPFVQYSVDAYAVRLIALDTLSEASNMGDFCAIRANSLRQALNEDAGKPTAIFMHHPPFEVIESKYRWQFDAPEAIATLGRALGGQDQVVRAFCGHAHRAAAGLIAGIPVSCVPSVAIDLRLGEFTGAAKTAPVYQIHRLDSGHFVTETRTAA